VWMSVDGLDWARVPAKALEGIGRQRISSLVPFDTNRMLAAGSQDRGGDEQAAAWIATLRPTSP
jgi:hypothetical protein